jgi:hypothetical protein
VPTIRANLDGPRPPQKFEIATHAARTVLKRRRLGNRGYSGLRPIAEASSPDAALAFALIATVDGEPAAIVVAADPTRN